MAGETVGYVCRLKRYKLMQNPINTIIKYFFTYLILSASFLTSLYALEVPVLKSRVNDYANMLSPQTRYDLEAKLEQLEKSDSTQIIVLTIPSLEGDAIENFSIRVAERWKIGQKKLDNGAILVVSDKDRKVRIEVGYGLEGKLTDLISGRIISDIIIPNFKNNNFDQGVIDSVDAIISVVRGEFKANEPVGRKKSFLSGNGIFFVFFLLFFIGIAGSVKKIFGGMLGAAVFPIIGLFALPLSIWLLLLIPVGFLAGLIIPVIMSGIGHGGGWSGRGGGGFSIGGGGGFSSGGFGGGGGGSFGGGGASGDW
jgi:uncharacterized protein